MDIRMCESWLTK